MFITDTIGAFPFYITTEATTPDIPLNEPFFYHLEIKLDDEGKPESARALCEFIPCSMCELQSTCKDGAHVTSTITDYFKDNFPELLI